MAKNKGFIFTLFAALGALTGYATYMANKDEFSEETKDKYGNVLNKVRNVGNDIQRTYTAIGDKNEFSSNTKKLGNSAKLLATETGNLVASATSDIYKSAKKNVTKVVKSMNDNKKSKTLSNKKSNKKNSTKKSNTSKSSKRK